MKDKRNKQLRTALSVVLLGLMFIAQFATVIPLKMEVAEDGEPREFQLVRLGQKFWLNPGEEAEVINYNNMRIRLNPVAYIQEEDTQDYVIDETEVIDESGNQIVEGTDCIRPPQAFLTVSMCDYVAHAAQNTDTETIILNKSNTDIAQAPSASDGGSGGGGYGCRARNLNLYEGEEGEAFGAEITFLKKEGNKYLFVVGKEQINPRFDITISPSHQEGKYGDQLVYYVTIKDLNLWYIDDACEIADLNNDGAISILDLNAFS